MANGLRDVRYIVNRCLLLRVLKGIVKRVLYKAFSATFNIFSFIGQVIVASALLKWHYQVYYI